MRALNIDRMPTVQELRQIDMGKLEQYISKNGGFIKWAEILSLSNKIKVSKMSLGDVKNNIVDVMDSIGTDRMPSRSEILDITGDYVLHNKIVRTGGYRYWADSLDLEIKDSETKLGQSMEDVAQSMIIENGFAAERMTTQYPFDILVNGNIKVDIKSGRAYDLRGSRCHTFGINKRYASCDLYMIFALSEDGDTIERTFIIPSNKLRVVTMSIGANTKYSVYQDRWDYFNTYDEFYKNIV